MLNNDLERLISEFHDKDDYPIELTNGRQGKKMIIPCRFMNKGTRNFLDNWNPVSNTANICYSKKVWEYLKASNSSLYPWLQESHESSSGTLWRKFYDFDKVRRLLSLLRKDYLNHQNSVSLESKPKQTKIKLSESQSKQIKVELCSLPERKPAGNIFDSRTTNYIYLVVGRRNTFNGAIKDHGGLWANVGMTSNGRSPEDRIKDRDYKNKQTGGELIVIKRWDVGNLTDHDVHKLLKICNDVEWKSSSKNTEEFLFKGDNGKGKKAIQIIEEILQDNLLDLPKFMLEKIKNYEKQILRGSY